MGKPVEIQVRSRAQDRWAQISEKLADRFGLEVKYGSGPEEVRSFLDRLSALVADAKDHLLQVEALTSDPAPFHDLAVELEALKSGARQLTATINRQLESFLDTLSK